MRRALGLHSDDFLERYALYRLDPLSGFPVLSLKMADGGGECPFVGPDGCTIYHDRPTACRLYPLGHSSGVGRDGVVAPEAFFYLLDTPGCEGLKETRVQSVAAWQEEQGLRPYIEMNDRMLGLLFHPRRGRSAHLDLRQQQKVMVACYNIDLFREFAFKTRLMEASTTGNETRDRSMEDDAALLALGFAYLNETLFP
jgi:Fe-S-cluster containining protein